jgi:hypothetical protein
MASQREMYQRETADEETELKEKPEEERAELVLIYPGGGGGRARGRCHLRGRPPHRSASVLMQ